MDTLRPESSIVVEIVSKHPWEYTYMADDFILMSSGGDTYEYRVVRNTISELGGRHVMVLHLERTSLIPEMIERCCNAS